MKTLVTLATYKQSRTAYFLKENLENEGIDCYLAFRAISLQDSDEVQIQVGEEDVERAIQIMLNIREKYGKKIEAIEPERRVQRIIVPIDFSRVSENACYNAVHLAQKIKAEIKILHVYENPLGNVHVKESATFEVYTANLYLEAEKKAKADIVDFMKRIRAYMTAQDIKDVKVHSSTIMGNIVWRIRDICHNYRPDLIVLGTSGRMDKYDSVLSGVPNEIIRGLGIPVYAIPWPFIFREMDMVNILYATDFNEKDHVSLDKLLEIVKPFEKRITCVHIDTEGNPVKKERMYELNTFLMEAYKSYDISCRLIEDEDVYHGIREFAEKNKINLLSFTTQKKGIFEKLFRPNLLKKILQEASLPILIFPS